MEKTNRQRTNNRPTLSLRKHFRIFANPHSNFRSIRFALSMNILSWRRRNINASHANKYLAEYKVCSFTHEYPCFAGVFFVCVCVEKFLSLAHVVTDRINNIPSDVTVFGKASHPYDLMLLSSSLGFQFVLSRVYLHQHFLT